MCPDQIVLSARWGRVRCAACSRWLRPWRTFDYAAILYNSWWEQTLAFYCDEWVCKNVCRRSIFHDRTLNIVSLFCMISTFEVYSFHVTLGLPYLMRRNSWQIYVNHCNHFLRRKYFYYGISSGCIHNTLPPSLSRVNRINTAQNENSKN